MAMISVMNDSDIDGNPSSASDLSSFGVESPKGEKKPDPIDLEISPALDPPLESRDLEESRVRVSPTRVRVTEEDHLDMSGFLIGDMVWGKVKSHPWWPGHIFNEAFASPSVRRSKKAGHALVAFFGDSSYGWFDQAELIPYESNFAEKSKQTTQKSFVKAVEESIDETGRRAALGLSCRCRNPYNFRPMKVPNYFEVDVVGYERNGIYSKRQINRERNSFQPKDALGFLQQLALTPREKKVYDVEWYRRLAVWLAVRRYRYEEFDETYAQAFGQQPVRPVRDENGVALQAESFAPRGVPLSGLEVFADSVDDSDKKRKKKSAVASSSSSKHSGSAEKDGDKPLKKKKRKEGDNFVLKRRDDYPAPSAFSPPPPPLPDAYFPPEQQRPVIADPSASASDYVLQKRELAEDAEPDFSIARSPQTPPIPVVGSPEINGIDEKPKPQLLTSPDVVVKKEKEEKKVKKRPVENESNQKEVKKEKKKKKKKKRSDGFGQDFPPVFKKPVAAPEASPPRPVSPPVVDLGPLDRIELPSVIADLSSLALDPFYGADRKAPSIVRHVLLRFRSLVYSKSLVIPSSGEGEAQVVQEAPVVPARKPKEQKDQPSSSKPTKLMKRPDDPTKAGRKRALSDRQEEKSAKRLKKVDKLKALATERKAAVAAAAAVSGPSTTETSATTAAVKKPEKREPLLPLPPKRESPTFLIMKFPPRSTLPSVANLKARFARFGPLEVDSTRVFWKSHSCRVQFKYKPDALKALGYVQSNDIFGQIQVDYSVREVEAPAPEPQPQPDSTSRVEMRPPQAQGRLKSILKKPGDDAGRESQRVVKFLLAGNGNGSGNNSKPESPPPPTQTPAPKSASFHPSALPPPPPPQPRQTIVQPTVPPPAMSYEPYQLAPPLPPQHRSAEIRVQERRSNADISHQMLSLLLRCNDIVSSLRSLPDFVPYRPL